MTDTAARDRSGAAGAALRPPWSPTGSTRIAAVIGEPVRHSLSPVIHNAGFRAADLDWVYVALEVRAGDVGRALDGMRSLGIDGLSVTMPHKDATAGLVDELTDDARVLTAVNCVVRAGDHLVGHNTDGPGFIASLADHGFDPAGRRCVVLGAGGAARAVILALARAGAADVCVVNRTEAKAVTAAALAGVAGRAAGSERTDWHDDVVAADLVVNATSVGMGAGGPGGAVPAPIELIRGRQVIADLVVHPVQTTWLRAARTAGATTVDGVGMLVHQAAIAFEHWTGATAPVEVMESAARSHLA